MSRITAYDADPRTAPCERMEPRGERCDESEIGNRFPEVAARFSRPPGC
jgi:hypothetical protein